MKVQVPSHGLGQARHDDGFVGVGGSLAVPGPDPRIAEPLVRSRRSAPCEDGSGG